MAKILTMDDYDFHNKTTLVRVDFNSPIDPKTKNVLDDTRIRVHAETTIKELSNAGARTVIVAHQGRPGSQDFTPLKKHADMLGTILNTQIKYVDDIFGAKAQKAIKDLKNGEILLLENVRMYSKERTSSPPDEHAKSEFIQSLAPLLDVFINDAFATAHRGHASIVGFTALLPSIAGRVMERELNALSRAAVTPEKPCVYIFGGAKADDSLKISQYVLTHNTADYIFTGGVIGHLFLAATGIDLGEPNMHLLEKEDVLGLIPGIQDLMNSYPEKIKVPLDVACEIEGKRNEIPVARLPTSHPIYDVGKETVKKYCDTLQDAKTIIFSGPLGVYEREEFMYGTKEICGGIAASKAFSLIGGGHTVAAVKEFGLASEMSYISTAGGALIEFLMGEKLPGVVSLEEAALRLG